MVLAVGRRHVARSLVPDLQLRHCNELEGGTRPLVGASLLRDLWLGIDNIDRLGAFNWRGRMQSDRHVTDIAVHVQEGVREQRGLRYSWRSGEHRFSMLIVKSGGTGHGA